MDLHFLHTCAWLCPWLDRQNLFACACLSRHCDNLPVPLTVPAGNAGSPHSSAAQEQVFFGHTPPSPVAEGVLLAKLCTMVLTGAVEDCFVFYSPPLGQSATMVESLAAAVVLPPLPTRATLTLPPVLGPSGSKGFGITMTTVPTLPTRDNTRFAHPPPPWRDSKKQRLDHTVVIPQSCCWSPPSGGSYATSPNVTALAAMTHFQNGQPGKDGMAMSTTGLRGPPPLSTVCLGEINRLWCVSPRPEIVAQEFAAVSPSRQHYTDPQPWSDSFETVIFCTGGGVETVLQGSGGGSVQQLPFPVADSQAGSEAWELVVSQRLTTCQNHIVNAVHCGLFKNLRANAVCAEYALALCSCAFLEYKVANTSRVDWFTPQKSRHLACVFITLAIKMCCTHIPTSLIKTILRGLQCPGTATEVVEIHDLEISILNAMGFKLQVSSVPAAACAGWSNNRLTNRGIYHPADTHDTRHSQRGGRP